MVHPVRIQNTGNGFQLLRDGQPYFVYGIRPLGMRFVEMGKALGANSVRESPKHLDACEALGITMMVGLQMGAERDGFDYGNPQVVQEQLEKNRAVVETYKDHPALLLWAIGNEMDYIPGDLPYNRKLWDAVNETARMIHEVDPNHPALTVVGMGNYGKLGDLSHQCPDIDLLGINAYKAIEYVPTWLEEYHWNKPYVITEWGMSGNWEVGKTAYGVAIEETSSEKADRFRERYQKYISRPNCVGSYAFLWAANRQEHTHTWFNMFYDDGTPTECVQAMGQMWTGNAPEHPAPRIRSLYINGKTVGDDIVCAVGGEYEARIEVLNQTGGVLRYDWEFVPENKKFGSYAGGGEVKPASIEGSILTGTHQPVMRFRLPENDAFDIRLYVYVHDEFNNIALGNVPFHVERKNGQ